MILARKQLLLDLGPHVHAHPILNSSERFQGGIQRQYDFSNKIALTLANPKGWYDSQMKSHQL